MRIQICFLVVQSIIYSQYKSVNANPMIGRDVRRAEEGEFSSVVSIKMYRPGNHDAEKDHGCVGALISSQKVLTAAHGIHEIPPPKLRVALGSVDLRECLIFELTEIIIYNNWANKKRIKLEQTDNDIAIVLLKNPVPADIAPANIMFLPLYRLFGKKVVTAGWGRTVNNTKARFMDTVQLTILTNKACVQRVNNLVHGKTFFDDRYLCTASEPFAHLRKGDSGGPLFYRGNIIAINKGSCPFPDDNLHPEKVNIHLGIDYYKDFITDVMLNS